MAELRNLRGFYLAADFRSSPRLYRNRLLACEGQIQSQWSSMCLEPRLQCRKPMSGMIIRSRGRCIRKGTSFAFGAVAGSSSEAWPCGTCRSLNLRTQRGISDTVMAPSSGKRARCRQLCTEGLRIVFRGCLQHSILACSRRPAGSGTTNGLRTPCLAQDCHSVCRGSEPASHFSVPSIPKDSSRCHDALFKNVCQGQESEPTAADCQQRPSVFHSVFSHILL